MVLSKIFFSIVLYLGNGILYHRINRTGALQDSDVELGAINIELNIVIFTSD